MTNIKTSKKTVKSSNSAVATPATVTPDVTPAPNPPPPTPPATDPNAALEQYVAQTVAELDSVEVGLGADPPLSPAQKRHAAKLRKGGDKIIAQIGNLAQQQQLESPALSASAMIATLGKAQALQPLADRLSAFDKHVNDVIFTAQSAAMVMGQQFYALLQRRSLTDAELARAMQPVTAFFAYRHPVVKPKGTPTKPQTKATKKAVKALKKQAPGLLAGSTTPAATAGQGAAAAPAAAPQGGQAASTPAVATPAATTSAHS
jgi:hypothetical protein